MKKRGFKRNNPQVEPVTKSKDKKDRDSVKRFNCTKCDFKCLVKNQLENHLDTKHREKEVIDDEFNCLECDFQGNTEIQLSRHINLKHTVRDNIFAGAIKCRICEQVFTEKRNLMIHRKTKHSSNVAPCRNFETGNCPFTAEACWWNHGRSSNPNDIQCFICGESFERKSEMMGHRKNSHSDMIRPCTEFTKGKCRFQENHCWFNHEKVNNSRNDESQKDHDEEDTSSVFQEAVGNPKPPSSTRNQNPETQN